MSKIKIGDCYRFANEILIVDHFDDGIPYAIMDGNPEMVQVADIPLRTLHLPIGNDNKKYGGAWFDMIRSGVKKEEYREFFGMDKGSPMNIKRLLTDAGDDWEWLIDAFRKFDKKTLDFVEFKPWKVLHLTNGYGHDKPQLWARIESITIGRGKPEWGAPTDRDVFIIKLGEVFHSKNLKP